MHATYKGRSRFIRFASMPGLSDIIGCYRGRFLAVECKMPGNKPTDQQRGFLDAVQQAGGLAAVVYEVAEVAELLDQADVHAAAGAPLCILR